VIESPAIMFNKNWSGGAIASISHIAGGAAVIFGLNRVHLFRPNEWNHCRKKEATHNQTIAFLGETDSWHYRKALRNEKLLEHILDASSLALWYIKNNFIYEADTEKIDA